MARRKMDASASQRPFIMVYLDFLNSSILKNCFQKIVYLYLKLFADTNGRSTVGIKKLAYLTKISINKVKSTLNELIHMGLVIKEQQVRPDGGTGTNIYTIDDSCETWGVEPRPDGKRPFIKVYKDFLKNDQLDNCYQKLVYIYLGRFADTNQKCFPSIKKLAETAKIGMSKIKSTLRELKEKGMIDKENRWRKNGGKSSNLYTLLYNLKGKLDIGDSKRSDIDMDDHRAINAKELDSAPAKVQNQAPKKQTSINFKPNRRICQEVERYSFEKIHEYFHYNILLIDHPDARDDIDAVMGIIYDTLNTTGSTITVNGDIKPSQVVIGQMMKLQHWMIMYAIEQFKKQDGQRIKHPKAYMRSILYNAVTGGYALDIINQVAYNEAH